MAKSQCRRRSWRESWAASWGLEQALDQPIAVGQVGFDRTGSGLVTECEEPPHDGEEGSGRSGHHQQQIEQIRNGDQLAEGPPFENALENIVGALVNDGGGDGRMQATHGNLQFKML